MWSVAPSLDAAATAAVAKKIKTQTKNYPLEMLSLTRSKAVLSEKMWVRGFLYAAIWSLEDCPGYTSLLVQFYQYKHSLHVKMPTKFSRSSYDRCSTHTRIATRSWHETRAGNSCAENWKNYANCKERVTHTRLLSFFVVSSLWWWKFCKHIHDDDRRRCG